MELAIIILVSELSQAVVDAGAVPLLVLCIQEPEMPLKRIAASALSDICKHSPEVSYTEPVISALYNCFFKMHLLTQLRNTNTNNTQKSR